MLLINPIAENLKSHNLKVTPQRMAIYQFLLNTKSHPKAERIYNSMKNEYPGMSLATIYKTLETLKKAFLIQELNVGESSLRYDADISLHPHFYCNKCDEVYDLEPSIVLTDLKEKISLPNDFEVQSAQVYFFGKCSNCVTKD